MGSRAGRADKGRCALPRPSMGDHIRPYGGGTVQDCTVLYEWRIADEQGAAAGVFRGSWKLEACFGSLPEQHDDDNNNKRISDHESSISHARAPHSRLRSTM